MDENKDILKNGETKHKRPWEDYDYEAPIWEKDQRWMLYLKPYKFWIYGD